MMTIKTNSFPESPECTECRVHELLPPGASQGHNDNDYDYDYAYDYDQDNPFLQRKLFAGHLAVVLPRAKAKGVPPADHHEPRQRVHRPKHLGREQTEVGSVDHHRTEETDCQVGFDDKDDDD